MPGGCIGLDNELSVVSRVSQNRIAAKGFFKVIDGLMYPRVISSFGEFYPLLSQFHQRFAHQVVIFDMASVITAQP